MTTAAKKVPAKKAAVKKAPISSRGGFRPNAGRKAEDSATGVITLSIQVTPMHKRFMDSRAIGRSAYARKILDALMKQSKYVE